LQRECPLGFAGSGDDGLFDFHGLCFVLRPTQRGLQKVLAPSTASAAPQFLVFNS
jgi:hypothetical protein